MRLKTFLILTTGLFFLFKADSQITVTSSTFPLPGDTLRTLLDNSPDIDPGSSGEDMEWDFTSLEGDSEIEQVHLPPQTGDYSSDYPSATSMVRLGNNVESYFQKTNDGFYNLGIAGGDLIGLGFISFLKFMPPYKLRRSPMTYDPDRTFTETSSFIYRFSLDDLSSAILDSLGNLTLLVDSLRIVVSLERTDRVDAWGTMDLPVGSYEVLRERRMEISRTSLEAKFLLLGWTDVTDQIPAALPQLGSDTILTNFYFSKTEIEPIAVVTLNPANGDVQTVEFLSDGLTSSDNELIGTPISMAVFPNPANDKVMVGCKSCDPGDYHLSIRDLSGKLVKREKFGQEGPLQAEINLKDVPGGMYLISLSMDGDFPITSQKLFIKKS